MTTAPENAKKSKEATVTAPAIPAFDFAPYKEELANLFRGVVSDVSNPQFQELIVKAAEDATQLAFLRASGTPKAVAAATASLEARVDSMLQIPGLVSSARMVQFRTTALRIVSGLAGFATALVSGYAANAVAAAAATVNKATTST